MTKSGKSFWVKGFAAEEQLRGRRIVAVDVCDEYSQHGRPHGGKFGPLMQRMTTTELIECPEKIFDEDLALAVVPDDLHSPDSMAECFRVVYGLVRRSRRKTTLVLDEVGVWGRYAQKELEALATTGSHHELRAVFVAQRPALIPATVRSQCEDWVAFRTTHPADLEALRERTGSEEFIEAVKGLPLEKCLLWPPNEVRH